MVITGIYRKTTSFSEL